MSNVIEAVAPYIDALEVMPVGLWHLWVVYVLERLREHTTEDEYEQFLWRLSGILEERAKIGVW